MNNQSNLSAPRYKLLMALAALLIGSSCGKDARPRDKKPEPQPTREATIVVGNSAVRACDILLRETGSTIQGLIFADEVMGEWERWAPKVALSFSQRGDAAISGVAVNFSLVGTAAAIADAVNIESLACYDRTGRLVAAPAVEFK